MKRDPVRRPIRVSVRLALLFLSLLIVAATSARAAGTGDGTAFTHLESMMDAACDALVETGDPTHADYFTARFPDAMTAVNPERAAGGGMTVRSLYLQRPGSDTRYSLEAILNAGNLARIAIESWHALPSGTSVPAAALFVAPNCSPAQAREIVYGTDGLARSLRIVGPDLVTTLGEEPLNPPVPEGVDAKGVTVAVIDSGIAYDRPDIAKRLARDATGRLIGRDFWDLDPLPYDQDATGSPFVARRHGTLVADILLRVAGPVRLIPLRYPRPDMTRFGPLVEFLAEQGTAIATLAMGSDSPGDWEAFKRAVEAHPDILFIVSAGNDGRDIDRTPVFPAAFDLPNLLVVTSLTEGGRIAVGSNWGKRAVDIGLPAEHLIARDPSGRERPVSGSSFAVPIAAGLAARLKSDHPDWRAPELKAALLDAARPLPDEGDRPRIAAGWIDERPARP
ncbi:S8 family serine peptidase [Marivibrio halodurans]|uniref:S8 family serine peptidase n=1 Tax=Marivibrio halodurans TaxID=2039722 RepID=A0A8J7V2D0_9PROT|nr:S8 family serine peptidase [Marivibrio halodurans]MBP5856752.1 S8 family serine peptidase [Marivibrio halodurans]